MEKIGVITHLYFYLIIVTAIIDIAVFTYYLCREVKRKRAKKDEPVVHRSIIAAESAVIEIKSNKRNAIYDLGMKGAEVGKS